MKEILEFTNEKKYLIKLSLTIMAITGLIFVLFYFISSGVSINRILGFYDSVISEGNYFVKRNEADVGIINVQSYPTINGNWTVRFNTTGTADLSIKAVNGTEFGKDLEFLELKCEDTILTTELTNGVVFVEKYSCDEIGYETSKVLTGGIHTVQFVFGFDVEDAYNQVEIYPFIDSFEDNTEWDNFTESSGSSWLNSNNGDCGIGSCAHGSYCACAESGAGDTLEKTTGVNLASYDDCILYWSQFIDSALDMDPPSKTDYFKVDVWTSGDTWQNIVACDNDAECTEDAWDARSYDIDAGVGLLDDFKVKFYFESGPQEEVGVDKINITCTYTPNYAPIYSDNKTSVPNGTAYSPTTNYGFQINWTDPEKSIANATFWSDFNSTGNITVYNFTKDIFYINFTDIPAGTYYYKWYGNDTAGNENATDNMSYTIVRAGINIDMWLNGTQNSDTSITWPVDANATCKINISSQNIFNLTRNGTIVGNQVNQKTEYIGDLKASVWNFTCNYSQTQNYSEFTRTQHLTINKAPTRIRLYLNDTESNQTLTYGDFSNITASINVSTLFVEEYRNDTLVNNDTDRVENITDVSWFANGTYNITVHYPGSENYSSFTNASWIFVNKAPTNTTLYLNGTWGNKSYSKYDIANFTVTVNTTYDVTVKLDSNYTGWIIQQDTDSTLENFTNLSTTGTWWNMTGYFEGDENFTSSFETWYFNVTIAYGRLVVNISDPYYKTYTESNPLQVGQYTTFWINATINCVGKAGATCDEVNGTARYNGTIGTAEPNHTINVTEGGIPFYVIEEPLEKEAETQNSEKDYISQEIDTQEMQAQQSQDPNFIGQFIESWAVEIIQQEADNDEDGLPDVYTNITPVNSTFLEIYVNQTTTAGGYEWKVAICNISGIGEIGLWSYNPSLEVWTYVGRANFNKLTNIGMPSGWCEETGGYGLAAVGVGISGDRRYGLNFTRDDKRLRIYTGSSSEVVGIAQIATPFYPNRRNICRDAAGITHVAWLSSANTIQYANSSAGWNSDPMTSGGNTRYHPST